MKYTLDEYKKRQVIIGAITFIVVLAIVVTLTIIILTEIL